MAARFICQVEGCGKLYLEKKQYEIHLRHHKSYVPSKGRYFKCDHCESKFNTQGNLDVHVIHSHLSNSQVTTHIYQSNSTKWLKGNERTASDPFSGHGYSGNDGFSGTKTPDDAILFTVSGITVLVELFWKILMWI